ncbi:uncharacterized protein [Medicago truncatula]|uniref:uncharacterized protein n=1 Tax=Medicago truncatula TaxID=3880 RepID=UPI000D2F1850|nr:uncharacterized protein LOC112420070 [Medicago truncatula]
MWRLAKNILPNRHNQQRKGIVLDTSCPLCHSEAETVEHLFMNCNLSKLALFASPLRSHAPFNMDLHSYLLDWLSCAVKDDSQLFCTILWKLWYARNQAVFNGATTDPVNLAHTAIQFIQEFNAANVKQRPQPPRQRRDNDGTCQDISHHMFVDAGCFSNGQTGWGLILKNQTQTGIITHHKCKLDSVEVDPCLAEALRVTWALQVAVRLGIQSLKLSCDALIVVNCVNRAGVVTSIEPAIVVSRVQAPSFV